jgi:selenide,water dikinase
VGLDREGKRILLAGHAPLAYDLTSIDIGITPAVESIHGAKTHAIAVKPIGSFIGKLNDLLSRGRRPDGPRRIAVIGGGAGGVELILSLCARLRGDAGASGHKAGNFSFLLVTEGEILKTHNLRVRDAFRRVFAQKGIALRENSRVVAVHKDAVELSDRARLDADAVLITTDAAPPPWFAQTGLARDDGGFLAVGATLQSENDADVFAAGDCAAITGHPREKAGVFAVRAGPPLSDNLRRRATGRPLKDWRPQSRHLALISTGERYAIASRGSFKAEGRLVWILKDWIDRRWMRTYQDFKKSD